MALFLSTFINKVDKKGRVSMPAPFRAALGDTASTGVVLFPSFVHACVEGWSYEQMERLTDTIDGLNPFTEERDDFATAVAPVSHPLQFDPEGRILLPESLILHAGLEDLACFAGQGKTFRIWRPEAFQDFAAQARRRAKERRDALRWRRDANEEDGS